MLGRFVVIAIFTARKRSLGQGNIFAPSCHSVRGGGVPGQVPAPGHVNPPWQVHPPAGTPSDRYTPLGRYTPPGRYTPRQVPPWAGTPPRQVHPPGSSACCEIRATSGRYASYWNAFLCEIKFEV